MRRALTAFIDHYHQELSSVSGSCCITKGSKPDYNRPMVAPRVFISYTHDSPEHKDRILALSDRLRQEGVDCSIDQYEQSPEEG
jgi:hypothetical protein